MLYKFHELIEKVCKDENGVGVVFYYRDGSIIRRFYENFPGDLGIDRASRHFEELLKANKCYKVVYYHPNNLSGAPIIGESIRVYFYDWKTHKKINTRQDETVYFVYSKDGKTGIDYNGEFTPLTSFATATRSLAFEIIA